LGELGYAQREPWWLEELDLRHSDAGWMRLTCGKHFDEERRRGTADEANCADV
jgi:hypothetical protein